MIVKETNIFDYLENLKYYYYKKKIKLLYVILCIQIHSYSLNRYNIHYELISIILNFIQYKIENKKKKIKIL